MSRIQNLRSDSSSLYVLDTMSVISSSGNVNSDFRTHHKHASMSPDRQQIATFDPETYEIDIYSTEELENPVSTFTYSFVTQDAQTEQTYWSLAISDCVNASNERLVALSRFDSRDVSEVNAEHVRHPSNPSNDVEFGEKQSINYNAIKPRTWVISTSLKSEVKTEVQEIGGVVRFLDDDAKVSCPLQLKDKTTIVIVNASGIYKQTFQNSEIEVAREHTKLLSQIKLKHEVEQFYLPQKLSSNLSHPDYFQSGMELLSNGIIKNHFLVSSFKNSQNFVEMYDLITGDLEMVFQRRELPVSSKVVLGLPIFAISGNDAILAFCRGTTSITLYLMENGIEIVTKKMVGRGFQKIISMNFIDDDSKLLIILEGDESQVFVVWDLFTTHENTEISENAIRRSIHSDDVSLGIYRTDQILNSHGKVFAITDRGELISLLDNHDVNTVRNSKVHSSMTECEVIYDEIYNSIFQVNGDRVDASTLGKNKVVISHIEPWQKDKRYFRVSAYLHSDKRTQLIIGHDTVQVWRFRKLKDSGLHERVLEYIWAKNGGARIQIRQLLIGEGEFVLRLMVPSNEQHDPQPLTIHWPNNVNVLEGACKALRVLDEKKREVSGTINTNRREVLVEHAQRLVKRYIKRSGLFRLTDIRYSIVENLIRSRQTKLIQSILRNRRNGKNMRLHIPRLYSWANVGGVMKLVTKKTDLQVAIECTKRHANSALVTEFLLDYYADNAKDYNDPGWMSTVTQAIPLLYDYKLDNLVQDLFRKPCFGTVEAYTPPLHLSRDDQIKGNSTDSIHVVKAKPQLARKPPDNIFTKMTSFLAKQLARLKKRVINPPVINTSYNDRKVYMVPLPEFTVFPKRPEKGKPNCYSFPFEILRLLVWPRGRVITNVDEMSPFLRLIFEDGSTDLRRTPSITAVTSSKWESASHYYLIQISLYVVFGISFGILAFESAIDVNLTDKLISPASEDMDTNILNILFLFTGWHLIVQEIMEVKHEGLKRYLDIFNIFDIGAVLLPLILNIANWMNSLDYYFFTRALSFTILIMWFEFLLLMRYFESPGRFIHIITNILNAIWPFFAFMLIAVLGFSSAMFILLKNAPASQYEVDRFDIVSSENTTENLYPNLVIQHQFDRNSHSDNYYSNFLTSMESVFFWTNGRWDQLDKWDNYAVDVMSILGSLILVLIFQNMLIAFMNGAFEKAKEDSHNAVQVFRADLISEYETLDKSFSFLREDNARYIYFIPNPDIIDSWLLYAKRKNVVRAGEEDQYELTEPDDDDDYDDDDDAYKKHHDDSSSASNKTDPNFNSEDIINLVDEEHHTEHKSRNVRSLRRSSQLSSASIGSSHFGISDTNSNMLFPIPEGDASTIGVGEEMSPGQQVLIDERLEYLEHALAQRRNDVTARLDAIEQKLATVLEFLSDQ